ncbi:MAG: hypothetical protein DMG78_25625, partial [Acidobacteria bacterium]
MFRLCFHRTLQFTLILILGFMASVAVAQDPPKEQPKDQSKDELQPSQQSADKAATPQSQPADAVDPLKRPQNEKQRKKNAQALKHELTKTYKKWLD